MSDVQTENVVASTPPPTFGALEAKSQENVAAREASPPAVFGSETKIDQAPVKDAATAASPDPAKPEASAAHEGDKKPDEAVKADGEKADSKDPEKAEKPVVPEKYDLKLSDQSPLDEPLVEKIAAYAKAQGLSQEEAQNLVTDQEKQISEIMSKAVETRKAQWLKACEADKEIGGKNVKENITLAKDMLAKYGDEAFRKEADELGLGNHPGIVRMLVRIGKASANDKAVHAKATTTVTRSREEIMYDNPKSKQ